jgi:hypothetical protein
MKTDRFLFSGDRLQGWIGPGGGSLFVDQASPFVERIIRHVQFMPFPGVIGRLLQDLFVRFPMDLEIAVNPCLAETQKLHDILSLFGGSSRLHRPPIHGIAVFYSKGLATRGRGQG